MNRYVVLRIKKFSRHINTLLLNIVIVLSIILAIVIIVMFLIINSWIQDHEIKLRELSVYEYNMNYSNICLSQYHIESGGKNV